VAVHALVLALLNLGAILAGFLVFSVVPSEDQIAVQVPVAVLLNLAGWLAWDRLAARRGRLRPLRTAGRAAAACGLAMLVAAAVFAGLHYATQRYLTSFGNILGLWAYQAPVNPAIVAAAALRRGARNVPGGGREHTGLARTPEDQ